MRRSLLTIATAAVAVVALIVDLIVAWLDGTGLFGFVGLALSALGFALLFDQRWLGMTLVVAGTVVGVIFAVQATGSWTVAVFAMFVFAMRGRGALLVGVVVATTLYLSLAARIGDLGAPAAIVAATVCVAAAAAGSAVRLQEESWASARRRFADAVAARAVELEHAVSQERLRIARDLHDGVGHEIAAVNVSVGAAEVALPAGADAARQALHAARNGLQRILLETQQVLELLRSTDKQAPELTELARAEHIPALIDRTRASGASVEVDLDPVVQQLDPDSSAAAYRIVQEALTNAQRHGEGEIHFTMTTVEGMLVLEVRNSRRPTDGSAPRRKGFGIVGMRERARSAGGTLAFAETDDQFCLHVELPTREGRR